MPTHKHAKRTQIADLRKSADHQGTIVSRVRREFKLQSSEMRDLRIKSEAEKRVLVQTRNLKYVDIVDLIDRASVRVEVPANFIVLDDIFAKVNFPFKS